MLYPVIVDNEEIGSVDCAADAKELCGGFPVVFIQEEILLKITRAKKNSLVKSGYFVKADSDDFNQTYLSLSFNGIVQRHSAFDDITTKNNDNDDFKEISVWSLKEMLIQAYSLSIKSR